MYTYLIRLNSFLLYNQYHGKVNWFLFQTFNWDINNKDSSSTIISKYKIGSVIALLYPESNIIRHRVDLYYSDPNALYLLWISTCVEFELNMYDKSLNTKNGFKFELRLVD